MKRSLTAALVACALVLGSSCGDDESGDGASASGGMDGSADGGMDGGSGGDEAGTAPSDDPVGSCLIEEYGFCNDYWADSADEVEMFCYPPGVWSTTEPCDPSGACGICTTDAGFIARTYYFDGSGPEDMSQMVCENGQGVWEDIPDVTCS